MGLQCPKCMNYTLKIQSSLELPPDSRSDENTIQIIGCGYCDFEGIAIYEESRRGNIDDSLVNHTGYIVSASALDQIKKAVKEGDQKFFEVYDEDKRWTWIDAQTPKAQFSIKRERLIRGREVKNNEAS